MPWIPTDQALPNHPKLIRLAATLGIDKHKAIGHLVELWLWALQYAPDGDLSAFDDCEIAAGAGWPVEKTAPFIQALKDRDRTGQKYGFIEDDRNVLHDWNEYGGKLEEQRKNTRDRKRRQRTTTNDVTGTSRGRHGDVTGTSRGRHGDVTQGSNVTSRSRVEKSREEKNTPPTTELVPTTPESRTINGGGDTPPEDNFDESLLLTPWQQNAWQVFVERYPVHRRIGLDDARRIFKRRVISQAELSKLNLGFDRYQESPEFKAEKIMNIDKFMGRYSDYAKLPEQTKEQPQQRGMIN